MTESSYTSGSTATPPKLDTRLDLEQSDLSEFGNMFDSFGKNEIKLVEEPAVLAVTNTQSPVCLERLTYIGRPPNSSLEKHITRRI